MNLLANPLTYIIVFYLIVYNSMVHMLCMVQLWPSLMVQISGMLPVSATKLWDLIPECTIVSIAIAILSTLPLGNWLNLMLILFLHLKNKLRLSWFFFLNFFRYRIKISVIDEFGTATFVVFDRDGQMLLRKSCFDLLGGSTQIVCIVI